VSLMGDRSWLQSTIAFRPHPYRETMSPEELDVAARIADPLKDRGYRESDPGMFRLCPLGPVSIRREMRFLSKLRLTDLLSPDIALPTGEGLRRRDRAFYDLLGAERTDVPCKRSGCRRGAITQSAMCRVHHFVMIKERPCPFDD
jgi:hypothetical protein